jgi:hypothetical protein
LASLFKINTKALATGTALAVAFFVYLVGGTAVQAAPRTPTEDAQILEKLPVKAGDPTARQLAGLRAASLKAPSDAAAAAQLAEAYFDVASARGDPRYVGYAEAVINRFSQPLPLDLLSLRGVVRQYRHDFSGALADFADVLQRDPSFAMAHAWRGAIFLVQANYRAVQKECEALYALGRNNLGDACQGLAQAYNGKLEAGYQTLLKALNRVNEPESRLWVLTRLGEVAAWRGMDAQAQAHYTAALALGRDDVYLLAAWSDFLLDSGRFQEVVTLLARWESSDSLLLRLAEAEAALKLPGAERHVRMLADRYAAARARGDTTHRAEEARFELRLRKDASSATRLARDNYAVQREPRDARVLLEAALAAKDPASAKAALDWMRSSGFEDARMRKLGAMQ